MSKPIVDIAVACAAHQIPHWWGPLMGLLLYTDREGSLEVGQLRTATGALPDHKKNNQIGVIKERWSLTDANRNKIVNDGFLNGKADWVFWIDDDTVPPVDAIVKLAKAGFDFIAGLYFLPGKPYNPIAYKKAVHGLYEPVYNYPKGGIFQVDSVGMGCTLIHRSVYETIRDNHTVLLRNNGSIYPIHKSKMQLPYVKQHKKVVEPFVRNGVYHEQVIEQNPEDERNFPYYLLEHGRTEDHHFCELAANVGIKPRIDTTITCKHWKQQPTTVEDYDNEVEKAEGIFQ